MKWNIHTKKIYLFKLMQCFSKSKKVFVQSTYYYVIWYSTKFFSQKYCIIDKIIKRYSIHTVVLSVELFKIIGCSGVFIENKFFFAIKKCNIVCAYNQSKKFTAAFNVLRQIWLRVCIKLFTSLLHSLLRYCLPLS